MSKFDIIITHESHRFRVTGSASPYQAARTNCSNDDATPAEGGIEDINSVRLIDKKGNEVSLPDFMQEHLETCVIDENLFDNEITEALDECTEAAQEDRKEAE